MTKRKIFFMMLLLGTTLCDAAKIRVYLNAGHGSWGPDDRPMPTIPYPMLTSTGRPDTCGFYESNTNLWKTLECGYRLKKRDFSVMYSRRKNGPYPYVAGASNALRYNRALSEIAAEVDTWRADMFLSIHSNAASEGSIVNYPLLLYRGTDSQEYSPNSIAMCKAVWNTLSTDAFNKFEIKTHYTTTTNIRGDVSFYGSSWTNDRGVAGYLGVLHHTSPGFLSEGFFHTYQPARHRALNEDWCRQEGIRYYRGIINYFKVSADTLGSIMGQLHCRTKKTDGLPYFNYKDGSVDGTLPINGATVRLKDSNQKVVSTYKVDENYNGIFVFNDLKPGNYYIELYCPGYTTRQGRVNVTKVTANSTVYKTLTMTENAVSEPLEEDDDAINEVRDDAQAFVDRETVRVYDQSGRFIMQTPRHDLEQASLPTGIYMLECNGRTVKWAVRR